MDRNSHIIDKKRLNMYEKGKKLSLLALKYLFFSGIFLSGNGEYPPPPLTENHSAEKP